MQIQKIDFWLGTQISQQKGIFYKLKLIFLKAPYFYNNMKTLLSDVLKLLSCFT